MRCLSIAVLLMGLGTLGLGAADRARAQKPVDFAMDGGLEDQRSSADEPGSYGYAYPQAPTPQMIMLAKAQQRSAERSARLASAAWYGYNPSRPAATGTPFCGMYGASWQMPGGRPDAWYQGHGTVVILR